MSIPRYIVLDKMRGETPLQTIEKWKAAHPEYLDVRAAYAGRLDPMAEGKLLVLVGDECKRLAEYTGLDKEYEIEVLLDLTTDTGDTLGVATYAEKETRIAREATLRVLSDELGTHERQYPIFSSKTVKGKPLFLYALEGRIDTIEIPTHPERFYRIRLLRTEQIGSKELSDRIRASLSLVPRSDEPSKLLGADFRQDAVRIRWQELFATVPARTFTILTLSVTCGSGAYMRTLADRIGKSLGTRGLALSIRRTKIGRVVSFGRSVFWMKRF